MVIDSIPSDDDSKYKGFSTRHLNGMSDEYVRKVLNQMYTFEQFKQGDSAVIDEYKKDVVCSLIQTRVQIDDEVFMASFKATTILVNVKTCEMTSFNNAMNTVLMDSDDGHTSIIIDNIETHDSVVIYKDGKMFHDSKRVQSMAHYSSTSNGRRSFAIFYNQFIGYVNITVALINVALTEGKIVMSCIGNKRTHDVHHVVPVCEGGYDSRSNLIVVPREEHIKIHIYFSRLGYIKPDSSEGK